MYVNKRLEFQKQNRKEEERQNNNRPIKLPKSYNILHRLLVHHLTLTVIIHINTIFIYNIV